MVIADGIACGRLRCYGTHSTHSAVCRRHRYLDRIAGALAAVEEQTGGAPVTLLAHSAGGWLSRVFLLEARSNTLRPCTLVSLHGQCTAPVTLPAHSAWRPAVALLTLLEAHQFDHFSPPQSLCLHASRRAWAGWTAS